MTGFVSAGTFNDMPDTTVARWDPSQETAFADSDIHDPSKDFVGSFDAPASGDPIYKTNIQNGEPISRYDGNDYHSVSSTNWTTISPPFTVLIAVIDHNQPSSSRKRTFYQYGVNGVFWDQGSWAVFGQDSSGNNTLLQGNSTTPPFILGAVFDDDSELRENGTTTAGGRNNGAEIVGDLAEVGIGASSQGSDPIIGDLGERLVYNSDLRATNEISSEEQRLADKYGINL